MYQPPTERSCHAEPRFCQNRPRYNDRHQSMEQMVIQSGNDDYLDDTEENYNDSLQDEDTVTPMDQNDYDLEAFGGRNY